MWEIAKNLRAILERLELDEKRLPMAIAPKRYVVKGLEEIENALRLAKRESSKLTAAQLKTLQRAHADLKQLASDL